MQPFRILLILTCFLAACQDKEEEFDDSLPVVEISDMRITPLGPGNQVIMFATRITNLTNNVFLTYRQSVLFTAQNGEQVEGDFSLPYGQTLCPDSALSYSGNQSNAFVEGLIDSIITVELIDDNLIVIYGKKEICE